MKEIGLDISNHHSKHLEDVDWKNSDFAITLCGSANEICVSMPWPEKCKRLHWPIKDPESEDEFRNARDEINQRIVNLLSDF
jgi:arsenate reductase